MDRSRQIGAMLGSFRPYRPVRVLFDPFGAGRCVVSILSPGSLRSPGAKHGSTPSGSCVLRVVGGEASDAGGQGIRGEVGYACPRISRFIASSSLIPYSSSLIPRQLKPENVHIQTGGGVQMCEFVRFLCLKTGLRTTPGRNFCSPMKKKSPNVCFIFLFRTFAGAILKSIYKLKKLGYGQEVLNSLRRAADAGDGEC